MPLNFDEMQKSHLQRSQRRALETRASFRVRHTEDLAQYVAVRPASLSLAVIPSSKQDICGKTSTLGSRLVTSV